MQDLEFSRSLSRINTLLGLAELISKIKKNKEDAYALLNRYARYLSENRISTITLKQRVVTIKNFLEYHDIDISPRPRRFKLKVKLPRTVRRNKEAISKEDIIEILNATSDIRLKTFYHAVSSHRDACRRSFVNTCKGRGF